MAISQDGLLTFYLCLFWRRGIPILQYQYLKISILFHKFINSYIDIQTFHNTTMPQLYNYNNDFLSHTKLTYSKPLDVFIKQTFGKTIKWSMKVLSDRGVAAKYRETNYAWFVSHKIKYNIYFSCQKSIFENK